MVYWDSSALLKLYVSEADSADFEALARSEEDIACSAIGVTEILCALARKEREGDLKPGGAESLFQALMQSVSDGRVILIPYGFDVIGEVEKLVKSVLGPRRELMIRSLDVIHLASALAAKANSLVAADLRLKRAAVQAGLKVLP